MTANPATAAATDAGEAGGVLGAQVAPSARATEADWVLVLATDEYDVHLDRSTVVREEQSGHVIVVTRRTYHAPEGIVVAGYRHDEARAVLKIDDANSRMGIVALTVFWRGQRVAHESGHFEWQEIEPGTQGETIMRAAASLADMAV